MVNLKLEKIGMKYTKSKLGKQQGINPISWSGISISSKVDDRQINQVIKNLTNSLLEADNLLISTKRPLWTVGKK